MRIGVICSYPLTAARGSPPTPGDPSIPWELKMLEVMSWTPVCLEPYLLAEVETRVFYRTPISNSSAGNRELDVGPSNYKSSAVIFLEKAVLSLRACGPRLGEADAVQKGLLLPARRGPFLQMHLSQSQKPGEKASFPGVPPAAC